ncbi:MAG: class I SAM-dependent methyltransferase [Gammaproteobacteria bacterium]|nr:class I SAM-dependent methyltransferase [Gammaproteobacteria bacterium]
MSDLNAPSEFVDAAYRLEDDDMVEFYRKWAVDYDYEMLDKLGYISPASIAKILIDQLPDTEAEILDLGCGTGLTCRLLAERGYNRLDGIDLSTEMLKVSRERGIYRDLLAGDLNQPLHRDSDSYDGVISSGTFTHGHVGPEPMDEVIRVLKPGGILACTVHKDLWKAKGFAAKFAELVDQGIANQISMVEGSYYRDGPIEGWFCVYQKTPG